MTVDARTRLLAFYLPQFHPIPENDAWWGDGFTEWVNVQKATPLFPGHYQPHVPADLGSYDLRSPEVREAQANLAREFGVYGFCYYHYWFNGKILLGQPFDEVLASGKPDFPFCLCWANENWTRAWDGLDQQVLIAQNYSPEDDRAHIRWLANAFQHENYIRIQGKPLFLVYRASKIPDPLRTTSLWREEAKAMGIGDLFLCTVESLPNDRLDPISNGFDAAVEFQPDWASLGPPSQQLENGNSVHDYAAFVERMLQKPMASYPRIPCVTTGWDNTARRRENAYIFKDSTPELYGKWLGEVLDRESEENLVFINAWNEWGEGCHLEPCEKWGFGYLEATRSALRASQASQAPSQPKRKGAATTKVSVCIPTYNGAEYVGAALTSVLEQTVSDFELIVVDDCSTDGTEDVVRSISDPRLRYFKNTERLGLVGNWNRSYELSSGRYVSIFHQDDVMAPDNIEQKVRALDENPSVGFVYSNVHQIDAQGKLLSEWWYFKPEPDENGVCPGGDFFETLLSGPNIVCCPSAMVKRECFERLGGFDPRLPFTADWEMWLRIALHYDVAYLVEPLVKYRRHDGMETRNFVEARELESYYRAKSLALEKYPELVREVRAKRSKLDQEHMDLALKRARQHFRQEQYDEAKQYLGFAARIYGGANENGSDAGPGDWLLDLMQRATAEPLVTSIERTDNRRIVDDISGEELAEQIPVRKIIKALAFKIAAPPRLRWLRKFRSLGKRLVGE